MTNSNIKILLHRGSIKKTVRKKSHLAAWKFTPLLKHTGDLELRQVGIPQRIQMQAV